MKGFALFTIFMIPILIIVGILIIVALGLVLIDPGILLPLFISPKKKKNQEIPQQPEAEMPNPEPVQEPKVQDKGNCGFQICVEEGVCPKYKDTNITTKNMYPHGKKTTWDETEEDAWAKKDPELRVQVTEEPEYEESEWEKELRRIAKRQEEINEEIEEEEEEERMIENLDDMILDALMNEEYDY